MTDRIPPMFPHLSPRADKPSKTSRIIRIGCILAAILFLGYYEIRIYYIAHFGPPEYMSKLKELEGNYTYSCNEDNVFMSSFRLRPQPVFLPVVIVSSDPFSISMPLPPPDGTVILYPNYVPVQVDHYYLYFYFYYESDRQIKILSPYGGQLSLIPIRWNGWAYLVKPEDTYTLCEESGVRIKNCYYRKGLKSLQGEPTYFDGAPLCQQ